MASPIVIIDVSKHPAVKYVFVASHQRLIGKSLRLEKFTNFINSLRACPKVNGKVSNVE